METARDTDMGFGLGLLFGFLAVGAALFTLVAGSQLSSGIGFLAAVALASLSVAAIHLWG